MITKILKRAYEKKELISITTKDIEWDQSIIGYITTIDETFFTINEIDEYGKFDGNSVYDLNDVLCVQSDDWYLRNLKIIKENNSIFNPNSRVTIWKLGNELITNFQTIRNDEKITRFYFEEDNFIIGLILDFDNDSILIKNIGQNGEEEGISCYRIADIIGLRYDGLNEQKISLLYNKRDVFKYQKDELNK